MARNKNKKQQNDTEFSREIVANNAEQGAQNTASESTNGKKKY